VTTDNQVPEVSLELGSLIDEARQATGLKVFDNEEFIQPLEKLLWSLQNEARLNPVGRVLQRQRIVDVLVGRLRMQAFLQRYPEILDEQINDPLFIVGLPRTGTTMLHRTVAADPGVFAPLWYEVRYPVPPLEWDFVSPDPRIAQGRAEMDGMLAASPDLASIHPMDPIGPDEEIMLLEQTFYSYMAESLVDIPQFGQWLEAQDHTHAYQYLKMMLQFLHLQKKKLGQKGQRWVLKAPHHLHFMDLVFKVFPDARVVQSHRDPLQTIPSLASMIYSLWVIYSDHADPVAAGERWARKFSNGTRHTMEVRKSLPDDRFLDLWFKDTVSQPLVEIQKIYDFIDQPLTEQAKQEMQFWQDFNQRELRPAHDYTLEQFGYTEESLAAMFSQYRQQYILK
jgi:hypothetical protein